MELRCYSFIGGAPPIDSWSLVESTGVVEQILPPSLIRAIGTSVLSCIVSRIANASSVRELDKDFDTIIS